MEHVSDFNPYRILGVEKDASPDEIRTAFRQLVRLYHPDVSGGDRARYEQVIRANDILTDHDARGRFDRTGQCDATGPENMNAAAINFIVEYFKQCIEQTTDAKADACSLDLIKMGERYIQLREQQNRPRRLAHGMERAVKRLKKKSAPDQHSLLHTVLHNQINNYYRQVEAIEEQIDLHNIALAIITDYSFDVEATLSLGRRPDALYKNPNWGAL
jgi:curved DNA-binding protein CbpA